MNNCSLIVCCLTLNVSCIALIIQRIKNIQLALRRNSIVVLIHISANEWKSNCKVLYAQQPLAITEDKQMMKFSGSFSWCWNGSTATAIGFKNWNSAKHQYRQLWVLPVATVSLCCDHAVLPLVAKIRTKNVSPIVSNPFKPCGSF